MQSKDSMWKDKTPGGYEIAMERRDVLVEIAKKRLPPLVGQIFCDAIVTCLEIDMRQLSNLVITPEWIYATGQMKEGLAVAEREGYSPSMPSMKDTSTQTEFEDGIILANEAGSGPESSFGASNVDGLELLATLAVPSISSSGSSTPSSAETLCDPEIPAEEGSALSEQTQATASASVDASSSDAQARNPNEKGEVPQAEGD